ncbi:hypothetical protein BJY01DRAFT_210828 [Aspergillus pseudoustus]|uniref:Uncharacterized protein n=1 Tax=Aspergillus pseudoustus TaxID=1810923 RepID=A0ABR4KBP6_9EURO
MMRECSSATSERGEDLGEHEESSEFISEPSMYKPPHDGAMRTALRPFSLLFLNEAETGRGSPGSVEEISSEGDETKQGKVFGLFRRRSFGKNRHPSQEEEKNQQEYVAFPKLRGDFSPGDAGALERKGCVYLRYRNYALQTPAATQTLRLEMFLVLLSRPRSRSRYHNTCSFLGDGSPLLRRPPHDWAN